MNIHAAVEMWSGGAQVRHNCPGSCCGIAARCWRISRNHEEQGRSELLVVIRRLAVREKPSDGFIGIFLRASYSPRLWFGAGAGLDFPSLPSAGSVGP